MGYNWRQQCIFLENKNQPTPIEETTFADLNMLERDIEEMLRLNIDMLCETDEESMLIVGQQVKNVQNGKSVFTKRWKNVSFRWTSCLYAAMAERCFWVVLRADIRLCRIKRKRKNFAPIKRRVYELTGTANGGNQS